MKRINTESDDSDDIVNRNKARIFTAAVRMIESVIGKNEIGPVVNGRFSLVIIRFRGRRMKIGAFIQNGAIYENGIAVNFNRFPGKTDDSFNITVSVGVPISNDIAALWPVQVFIKSVNKNDVPVFKRRLHGLSFYPDRRPYKAEEKEQKKNNERKNGDCFRRFLRSVNTRVVCFPSSVYQEYDTLPNPRKFLNGQATEIT